MQLSSGQLMFCSFLVFKIHLSNSFVRYLKHAHAHAWADRLTNDGRKIERRIYVKHERNLIIYFWIPDRPTYLHFTKTSNPTIIVENSNYFTLRKHWLVRNRPIKVKQSLVEQKRVLLKTFLYIFVAIYFSSFVYSTFSFTCSFKCW